MRMTWYYLTHAFINQIRKLFRTWVAVLLGVCVLAGVVFGVGFGLLFSALDDEEPESGEMSDIDDSWEEEPGEARDPAQAAAVLELIIGGVVLAGFTLNVLTADKSGGSIFLMADVNLLFPSPRRPQSVLLFRLISQMGMTLLASLWIFFQIPNLTINLGLSLYAALALVLAWLLFLVVAKLLLVWVYTLTATREGLKKWIHPVMYGILLAVGGSFVLYWRGSGTDLFTAACRFFNAPASRWIPLWGWIKGTAMGVVEGNLSEAVLFFLLLAVAVVGMAWAIWRFPADFYEDALSRSEELDAARRAAKEKKNGFGVTVVRKKERSDRIRRDGIGRGWGASVYFTRTMYNRFRFAWLHVFTKTSLTYLTVSMAVCALTFWVFDSRTLVPVALVLAAFVFYRSLGNPISQDTEQVHYRLVPESAHAKYFFSLMGGTVNCLLDLLPAFAAAALWMGADLLTAALWLLLILSLDLYSSSVGAFIELSLPTALAEKLRAMVQVLFVYFGMLPAAVLVIVGLAADMLPLFMGLAILCDLAVAGVLYGVTPLLLIRGQK